MATHEPGGMAEALRPLEPEKWARGGLKAPWDDVVRQLQESWNERKIMRSLPTLIKPYEVLPEASAP